MFKILGFGLGSCGNENDIAKTVSNILIIIGIVGLIAATYYYSNAITEKEKKVIVRDTILGLIIIAVGWYALSIVATCNPSLN